MILAFQKKVPISRVVAEALAPFYAVTSLETEGALPLSRRPTSIDGFPPADG